MWKDLNIPDFLDVQRVRTHLWHIYKKHVICCKLNVCRREMAMIWNVFKLIFKNHVCLNNLDTKLPYHSWWYITEDFYLKIEWPQGEIHIFFFQGKDKSTLLRQVLSFSWVIILLFWCSETSFICDSTGLSNLPFTVANLIYRLVI